MWLESLYCIKTGRRAPTWSALSINIPLFSPDPINIRVSMWPFSSTQCLSMTTRSHHNSYLATPHRLLVVSRDDHSLRWTSTRTVRHSNGWRITSFKEFRFGQGWDSKSRLVSFSASAHRLWLVKVWFRTDRVWAYERWEMGEWESVGGDIPCGAVLSCGDVMWCGDSTSSEVSTVLISAERSVLEVSTTNRRYAKVQQCWTPRWTGQSTATTRRNTSESVTLYVPGLCMSKYHDHTWIFPANCAHDQFISWHFGFFCPWYANGPEIYLNP